MSDRLAELRRQRALVQEHLAWLDRELADLQKASPTATPRLDPASAITTGTIASGAARQLAPVAPSPVGPEAGATAPDALIDKFRIEPDAVKKDVRKGCFLYFAAAFALLFLVVGILYVTLSSR